MKDDEPTNRLNDSREASLVERNRNEQQDFLEQPDRFDTRKSELTIRFLSASQRQAKKTNFKSEMYQSPISVCKQKNRKPFNFFKITCFHEFSGIEN